MAVSRIQDEVLQCTICYDIFQTPKTLPCLHTFCEKCLSDYITGSVKKMGFSCPVCREFIKPPQPKRPAEEWASTFKTNFHLSKLMKAIEDNQDETTNEEPRMSCKDHPQKEVDLFCVPCAKPICHLCAGISHRGCQLVMTLEEVVDDRRVELERIGKKMDADLSRSRDKVSSVKKQLESVTILKNQCNIEIKSYADGLVNVIRRREEELLKELDEKHMALNEKVDIKIDKFREQQKMFHQNRIKIRDLALHGNTSEVVSQFASLSKRLPLDLSAMTSLSNQLEKVDVKFVQSTSIQRLAHTSLRIGEVLFEKVVPETAEDKAKPRGASRMAVSDDQDVVMGVDPKQGGSVHFWKKRSQTLTHPPTPCPQSKKPTKLRTIPCKHRDDEQPPRLIDITVLPREDEGTRNDVILVTDWNNQCVKAYRSRRDRDSRLPLGGKPRCITALTHSTVAVSIPLSQQICVLKVGVNLMVLSSVIAEKKYSGLAALNKSTLVASGSSTPPSVDIINVSGEVLHTFSNDSSGSPLFSYPSYVCTTPNGNILVSDREAGTLTCLAPDGNVVWCFQPKGSKQLLNPAGVHCDSDGNVLFLENRGMLSLTARGQYRGVVLKGEDGVDAPKGVWSGGDGTVYLTQKEQEICVFKVNKTSGLEG